MMTSVENKADSSNGSVVAAIALTFQRQTANRK